MPPDAAPLDHPSTYRVLMSAEIIGLTDWLRTAAGHYLLDWEQERFDEAVGDLFGFHALQLGLTELPALQNNRMPHRWLGLTSLPQEVIGGDVDPQSRPPLAALVTDPAALPFPANSLDLVLLPHTLELSADPHTTLREVERVLVPEGRVVISGLNPASLWGFRQQRARWMRRLGLGHLFLPEEGEFIGYWRLRDWLRLLSFEVESARFGCYRPALNHARWLQRFAWMDPAGARWWPIFGAVYFLVAVKRVRGMRLLEPAWKGQPRRVNAPAVATRREGRQPRPESRP